MQVRTWIKAKTTVGPVLLRQSGSREIHKADECAGILKFCRVEVRKIFFSQSNGSPSVAQLRSRHDLCHPTQIFISVPLRRPCPHTPQLNTQLDNVELLFRQSDTRSEL